VKVWVVEWNAIYCNSPDSVWSTREAARARRDCLIARDGHLTGRPFWCVSAYDLDGAVSDTMTDNREQLDNARPEADRD
jgi:hypothetical protein